MPPKNYVFAIDTIIVAHGGVRVTLHAGEAWAADDALVVARPELFAKNPTTVRQFGGGGVTEVPVEQATSAPGEKRATRRAV